MIHVIRKASNFDRYFAVDPRGCFSKFLEDTIRARNDGMLAEKYIESRPEETIAKVFINAEATKAVAGLLDMCC